MTRHRQIHQIRISQIDLRNAASPLHHDGVITCCQTIEGLTDFFSKINIPSTLSAPVVIRMLIAHWFAIQYHL